jgi:hypothetical protein
MTLLNNVELKIAQGYLVVEDYALITRNGCSAVGVKLQKLFTIILVI